MTLLELLKLKFKNQFVKYIDLPEYCENIDNCNYIDISKDDPSKYSYYNFDRYLKDIERILYYDFKNREEVLIIKDNCTKEEFDSFLNTEIEGYNSSYDDEDYARFKIYVHVKVSPSLRYHTSVYKLVKKIAKEEYHKQLTNYILAKTNFDFKIVTGEDIRYWYHQDQYLELKGELGTSCMRYESCQEYFDLYTENPQVSMAILHLEDKLLARCIIWNNYYIDRRYGISTKEQDILFEKVKDHLGTYQNIWLTQSDFRGDIVIELDKTKFDYYPFCDSLFFLNTSNNTIHNDKYGRIDKSLGHLEGDSELNNRCYHYKKILEEEDRSYCDCCDCEIDDNYSCYSEYHGESYCNDCVFYCEQREDYFREHLGVYCPDNGRTYHRDECVRLHNGDYTLTDNAVYNDYDDEYYLCDEVNFYELPNGDTYDCTEEQYEEMLEKYYKEHPEEDPNYVEEKEEKEEIIQLKLEIV